MRWMSTAAYLLHVLLREWHLLPFPLCRFVKSRMELRDRLTVPLLHSELCSKRLLVMEYIDGCKITKAPEHFQDWDYARDVPAIHEALDPRLGFLRLPKNVLFKGVQICSHCFSNAIARNFVNSQMCEFSEQFQDVSKILCLLMFFLRHWRRWSSNTYSSGDAMEDHACFRCQQLAVLKPPVKYNRPIQSVFAKCVFH